MSQTATNLAGHGTVTEVTVPTLQQMADMYMVPVDVFSNLVPLPYGNGMLNFQNGQVYFPPGNDDRVRSRPATATEFALTAGMSMGDWLTSQAEDIYHNYVSNLHPGIGNNDSNDRQNRRPRNSLLNNEANRVQRGFIRQSHAQRAYQNQNPFGISGVLNRYQNRARRRRRRGNYYSVNYTNRGRPYPEYNNPINRNLF